MILILDDDQKKHISFLTDCEPEICDNFCKLSIDFLLKGTNSKAFSTAAQRLGTDIDVVKNAVMGVMKLLTESAKSMLSDTEFQDTLIAIGFAESSREILSTWFKENRILLRNIQSQKSIGSPEYVDLSWRFEAQIASRFLRHQVTPLFQLQLSLRENCEDKDSVKNIRLQTDPVNLINMTQVLEQALAEAKSQHSRSIARHVK